MSILRQNLSNYFACSNHFCRFSVLALFSLLLGCESTVRVYSPPFSPGTLSGLDDRKDYSEVRSRRVLRNASSVGTIIENFNIPENTELDCDEYRCEVVKKTKYGTELSIPLLGAEVTRNNIVVSAACPGVKFIGQPKVTSCTAFLINQSQMITAAHCVNNKIGFSSKPIEEKNWIVFNYDDRNASLKARKIGSNASSKIFVDADDVYEFETVRSGYKKLLLGEKFEDYTGWSDKDLQACWDRSESVEAKNVCDEMAETGASANDVKVCREINREFYSTANDDEITPACDKMRKNLEIVAEVAEANEDFLRDWAVIELDRPVSLRKRKPIKRYRNRHLKENQKFYTLGYPFGTALKHSPDGKVLFPNHRDGTIRGNLDITPGNSGGPAIDHKSNRVFGIVTAAPKYSRGPALIEMNPSRKKIPHNFPKKCKGLNNDELNKCLIKNSFAFERKDAYGEKVIKYCEFPDQIPDFTFDEIEKMNLEDRVHVAEELLTIITPLPPKE